MTKKDQNSALVSLFAILALAAALVQLNSNPNKQKFSSRVGKTDKAECNNVNNENTKADTLVSLCK